jgi:hypothetical protein
MQNLPPDAAAIYTTFTALVDSLMIIYEQGSDLQAQLQDIRTQTSAMASESIDQMANPEQISKQIEDNE